MDGSPTIQSVHEGLMNTHKGIIIIIYILKLFNVNIGFGLQVPYTLSTINPLGAAWSLTLHNPVWGYNPSGTMIEQNSPTQVYPYRESKGLHSPSGKRPSQQTLLSWLDSLILKSVFSYSLNVKIFVDWFSKTGNHMWDDKRGESEQQHCQYKVDNHVWHRNCYLAMLLYLN